MNKLNWVIWISLSFWVCGCLKDNGGQIPDLREIEIERLASGEWGTGYEQEEQLIIQDEAQFLNRYPQDSIPPSIDFTDHSVLFAAWGLQPTAGKTIRISRVYTLGDTTYVNVTRTLHTCVVDQVFNTPYYFGLISNEFLKPNVKFTDVFEDLCNG